MVEKELLAHVRTTYKDPNKNNTEIPYEVLQSIYGKQIETPQGCLEILEELLTPELYVPHDPVFHAIDEHYSDLVHQNTENEALKKRYEEAHSLLEKRSLQKFNARKNNARKLHTLQRRRALDELAGPSDEELRALERKERRRKKV
jgi:hypothetical protein